MSLTYRQANTFVFQFLAEQKYTQCNLFIGQDLLFIFHKRMQYNPSLNKMTRILIKPSLQLCLISIFYLNESSSRKWRIYCLYLEGYVNSYLSNLYMQLANIPLLETSVFPYHTTVPKNDFKVSKFCISFGLLLSRFYPGFINGSLHIIISVLINFL